MQVQGGGLGGKSCEKNDMACCNGKLDYELVVLHSPLPNLHVISFSVDRL